MKDQRNVLVTGADGGLGIPVVTRLLQEGWKVNAFLHTEAKINGMRRHFPEESDKQLLFFAGDVTRPDDIETVIEQIKTIHAVVHLAGGFAGAATFGDSEPDIFDRMFTLNTRSAYLLIRTVLPRMKKDKQGAIVTIGAKPAIHPGAVNAVYAASKAALINLTMTAAEEGRQYNVRANTIVPAVIRTAENMRWISSEKEADKWTPPEDIARIISWLISEAGASVTGTIIPVFHQMEQ